MKKLMFTLFKRLIFSLLVILAFGVNVNLQANSTIRNWLFNVPTVSSQYRLYTSTNNYLYESPVDVLNYTGSWNMSAIAIDTATINIIDMNAALGFDPAHKEGRVFWDEVDHTLSAMTNVDGTILQIGQEQFVLGRNTTGSQLDNGTAVYISTAVGQRPTILKADASDITKCSIIGVTTADIDDNTDGYVTIQGKVRSIDTSDFAEGDTIYLSSSVAGGFQNTIPPYPNSVIKIGKVLYSNSSQGQILVNLGIDQCSTASFNDARILNELFVSSISANDSNGLYLLDDGDNGIYIADGGQVAIGTTTITNASLTVMESIDILSAGDGVIAMQDISGSTNVFINSGGNSFIENTISYSISSSTNVIYSSNTISAITRYVVIESTGGAVVLASNPQISIGVSDTVQSITLIGTSDTNTITLSDGNGLAMANGATTFTLGVNDNITFFYNPVLSEWIEDRRKDIN